MSAPRERNGGQILVEQLRIQGTKRVFLVPGESYLPCIDALYDHQDAITPIVCRQESGAGYMAEAYGKLTGEPGVCFVTRGPGATNASIAVHTAFQDSTPMILFVGQVGNDFYARGIPGDRLPPHVRPDGQVGGPDRSHGPDPRVRGASLRGGNQRASRSGGAGVARGHALGPRHGRRHAAL
jgi:hypothetical protein